MVGYLLWLASALACAYTFARRREPIYLAWILLFVYLFLDDATQIHEQYGYSLAIAMQWAPALALRARDFGELAVSAIAGTILLSTITFAYWRSDEAGRAFTRQLLPWLGALIGCGVGVDMLEIQLESFGSPLNIILEVVEDGGEMIAASFLTALSVREAMRVGSEALPVAALRHWVGAAWPAFGRSGEQPISPKTGWALPPSPRRIS